jgi:hypothetical protein
MALNSVAIFNDVFLDELLLNAVATNLQSTVDDDSVMGHLLASANVSNFDRTVHSAEVVGDAIVVIDGFHDVPTADSVANAQMRDVIGNKTDTVAGNSLVALAKDLDADLVIVDGFHDVPTADSVANSQMRDVIGNKTDTVAGDSVIALLKQIIASVGAGEPTVSTDGNVATANLFGGTATSGETGADIFTVSLGSDTQFKVHAAFVDMTNAGASARVTVRAYTDINGTERKIYDETFRKAGTNPDPNGVMVITGTTAFNSDMRVEMQSSASGDTSVSVDFTYIREVLL